MLLGPYSSGAVAGIRARDGAAGQFILRLTKRPDRQSRASMEADRRGSPSCRRLRRERADADLSVRARAPPLRRAGSGRPVLLIHGFTNYGLAWAPQLAVLVHAGYRVILPDLHGHGASAPATSLCTVADLAADMVGLLDHLAIDCAALCGLSLGGMVALQLSLERPDRVTAAIVANSRSSFVGPEMRAMVDGWTALLLQEDGARKRLRTTWPMLVNEPFRNSPTGNAVFEAWARVLAHVQDRRFATWRGV